MERSPRQALENEQARRYFAMGARSGVLVRGLFPIAAAARHLRRGDILQGVEGYPLANDGTIAVGQQVGAPQFALAMKGCAAGREKGRAWAWVRIKYRLQVNPAYKV